MALTRLGASAAEATSITIPGTYQAGDIIMIWTFRDGSTTQPSLPAGWTSFASTAGFSASATGGWKLATSGADTSGTWTNATEIVCHVYRGQATNHSPLGTAVTNTGNGTTNMSFNSLNPLKEGTSWVVGFGATSSIDTTITTAPSGLTNQSSINGATAQAAGYDSNAVINSFTGGSDVIGGTAGSIITCGIELFAEQLGNIENYKFAKVGDGMSSTEKIR